MKLRSSHARLVALATVLYAGTCCAQDASAVEPKAMDALKSMGTYLRTLQTFSLHSSTTTDQILDNGQKVQFEGSVDYRVRRPNALRADIHSDRVQRSFYFDGKTLTQYAPRMHFYGIVNAPPTIAELFSVLSEKYGVDLPLTDLFYWGTNQERVDEVKSAAYIGPAYVGGIDCDHYAFRQQDVDWQVWIQRGQKPLPVKLVITTTAEATQPQYVAQLKWNLTPKLDDKTFKFTPPGDARKIDLVPVAQAAAKQ